MKVIGLCGGSGSGKGSACVILGKLGIPSVDTDAVYHRITSGPSDCLAALVEEFGDAVVGSDGGLDRSKLAAIVFSGVGADKRRAKLNEITHAYILDETRRLLEVFREQGAELAVVDAPLLFESGFDRECDITVAVVASKDIRVARIMKRDGISKEDAERRVASQLPDDRLTELCHFTLVNDSGEEALREQIISLLKSIGYKEN